MKKLGEDIYPLALEKLRPSALLVQIGTNNPSYLPARRITVPAWSKGRGNPCKGSRTAYGGAAPNQLQRSGDDRVIDFVHCSFGGSWLNLLQLSGSVAEKRRKISAPHG